MQALNSATGGSTVFIRVFEYRYTDLGNKSVSGFGLDGDFYKVSTDQDVQGIYMTFGYRFDGF